MVADGLSTAALRRILDNAGCIVVQRDRLDRIEYLNPRGLATVDAAGLEEVVGRPFDELFGARDDLRWVTSPLHDADGEVSGSVDVGHESAQSGTEGSRRALETSERTLRELAENLDQCVWIKDPQTARTGRMSYVSPVFERVFGISPESLYGAPERLFELVHPDDLERFQRAIGAQFERDYDVEYRIVRPDGQQRWIWSRAAAVRDARGQVLKLVGLSEDITQRKQAEERIRALNEQLKRAYAREQQLSRTDELTGVGNRHRYAEEVERLCKVTRRAAVTAGAPRYLAAIIIDIDHFKPINDRHGHGAGDRCLVEAAAAIRGSIREIDVVTRVGGDEFFVLLPEAALEEARGVAERIRQAMQSHAVSVPAHSGAGAGESGAAPDGGDTVELTLSASFGVAVVDGLDERLSADRLYRLADEALYQAKARGRGRVACMPHPVR